MSERQKLTEKERHICIIALSNLDSLLESARYDPTLAELADNVRQFLRAHDIHNQDIKELALKFGVPEKTVFKAGLGLQ
jgi:DNA-directed RNA polymerase specialized sigma24 family protein